MTNRVKSISYWRTFFYLAVFLVIFLPRAWHPLSRSIHWMKRAERYYTAIFDDQNWRKTFQRAHPGVTTMIAAGASSRLYFDALESDSPLADAYLSVVDWAAFPQTTEDGMRVVAANLGLALALAALTTATVWALKKLGDWPLAVSGAVLLALSPALLTHGRIVHLDAMVSHLMLLSALFTLLYADTRQGRYLVFSGLVGGLSMLTKPVSIFMVPFTGLVLNVYLIMNLYRDWSAHPSGRFRWVLARLGKQLVLPLLIWLLLAAVVFVIWPSMWVRPVESIEKIINNVSRHASEAHPNPRFFLGKVYTDESPNLLFYPLALLFNTSFITLPLAVLAVVLYVLKLDDRHLSLPRSQFWLLAAFVVFFLIQMSLGAKQTQRYILPAHAVLEVVAAAGLAGLIRLVQATSSSGEFRLHRWALPGLTGLVLVFHLILLAVYFPNIGAHKNHLLGGSLVTQHVFELGGNNEGIIPVTEYLNAQSNTSDLLVGMPDYLYSTVPQYTTVQMKFENTRGGGSGHFLLYTAEMFQRYQIPPEEVEATPHITITYDGVPYMILYALDAQPMEPPTVIRRGGIWLIALAWVWMIFLAAAAIWSVRRLPQLDQREPHPAS